MHQDTTVANVAPILTLKLLKKGSLHHFAQKFKQLLGIPTNAIWSTGLSSL